MLSVQSGHSRIKGREEGSEEAKAQTRAAEKIELHRGYRASWWLWAVSSPPGCVQPCLISFYGLERLCALCA